VGTSLVGQIRWDKPAMTVGAMARRGAEGGIVCRSAGERSSPLQEKGVEEKRWEAEEGVPYGDEAIM